MTDPAPADGLLPASAAAAATGRAFGVYLHVPFCRVRCGYCDFNTYTAGELRGVSQAQYADQAIAEVRFARGVLATSGAPDRPADTVGIGKVPVVKDLAYSEAWLEVGKAPEHKDAILKMGDLNVPLEFGFRWNEWRAAMDQELQLSYLGERSVDESVAAAHAAIQAVLDRP